jgi:hypothetical protein
MKCKQNTKQLVQNKHGASKIIDTFETYQCANLPTNVLDPIPNITLPMVWGQLPSISESCWAQPYSVIHPLQLIRTSVRNQLPSPLEDINRYSLAQSRDVYHGLPPIDFSRKESQSGYAFEDIWNSEVTSDSLVPYQVLWSARFMALWNDW